MYLGEYQVGQTIPFTFQALDGYGQAVNADSTPTFEVYRDNAPMTPPVVGTMSQINGQTGFYGGTVQTTLDNGFTGNASYTIRINAVINGITTLTTHTFQLAAFVEPDNNRTLPPVLPPQVFGDLSMFERALLNSSPWMMTEFDSVEAVYQPFGGAARTIRVLPLVEDIATTPAPHGTSPTLRVQVINSPDYGIASTELDCGRDTLRLPTRIGRAPVTRRITKILSQDIAMMTLEVR